MALSEYQKQLSLIRQGLAPKTTGKKPPKQIAKVSKKKLLALQEEKKERETSGDFTLDKWFEYHMEHSEPVCAECGARADWVKQPGYETIWRACQAHILPKKKKYGFPSISTRLENHIVLFPSWGGHLCGCHGFYDSGWFNATTMNIWPKIVESFKLLYPSIPLAERKNIPEQLLKEIQ